jgi:hypothetical protein
MERAPLTVAFHGFGFRDGLFGEPLRNEARPKRLAKCDHITEAGVP